MKISSDKAFQSKYCFVTFKHDIQQKNSECKQKNVIWIAFKHINKRNIGVGSRAHADG